MAHKVVDRVRETSVTSGTGTLTLAGAAVGFQSMATALPNNGDTGFFFATDGTNWEVFLGTRASSTTLSRTTVYASSNGGSLVNFSGASKDIVGDVPARFAELLNTQSVQVASAATTDIGAINGSMIEITGTTTITSLGTSTHKLRIVRFSGVLTLTHNATTLILPGGANITTAAGATATFVSDSSGNWRCWSYMGASVGPAVGGTFTPVLNSGGSATGWTLVSQSGTYLKVGTRVFFNISLPNITKGSPTVGAITITGLPFTSAARDQAVSLFADNVRSTTSSNQARVDSSSTAVSLWAYASGGGSMTAINQSNLVTGSVIHVSGSYSTT